MVKSLINFEKLNVIVATGMPGAYKVIVFFLIEILLGATVLGQTASQFSIAQILGFFTAIGWSSLILVRLPKLNDRKELVEEFNSLFSMGIIVYCGLLPIICLIGYCFFSLEITLEFMALSLAWSVYQFPRHYLLSLKEYSKLIVLDLLILISTLALVFGTNNPTLSISTPFIISSIIAIFLINYSSGARAGLKLPERKGIEFGFNNFLSGGLVLSLIPAAQHIAGAEFAGLISLFISITAVSLLIPRAISLSQLPQLAKIGQDKLALLKMSQEMHRQISLFNWLTLGLNILIAFIVSFYFVGNIYPIEIISMIFIILAAFFANKTLVYSNVLMVNESSQKLLLITFKVAAIYFCGLMLVVITISDFSFLVLTVIYLSCNIYRFLLARKVVGEMLCQ
ncbi:MAG: hypothetical protein ACI87J_001897 [Colwellia sp.]|jgi:hypothetical protein